MLSKQLKKIKSFRGQSNLFSFLLNYLIKKNNNDIILIEV